MAWGPSFYTHPWIFCSAQLSCLQGDRLVGELSLFQNHTTSVTGAASILSLVAFTWVSSPGKVPGLSKLTAGLWLGSGSSLSGPVSDQLFQSNLDDGCWNWCCGDTCHQHYPHRCWPVGLQPWLTWPPSFRIFSVWMAVWLKGGWW